jgi:hypothetical protein
MIGLDLPIELRVWIFAVSWFVRSWYSLSVLLNVSSGYKEQADLRYR